MMSAIVRQDWRTKTLKELVVQWETTLLETWHHTAHIQACFASKNTPYSKLHPYLASTSGSTAIKLTPVNLFERAKVRDGQRVSVLDEMLHHGQ